MEVGTWDATVLALASRERFALTFAALIFAGCCAEPPEPVAAPFTPPPASQSPAAKGLTMNEVLDARKRFEVQVLWFDRKNVFDEGNDAANLVRIRVTNNSAFTLPQLTVHTKRWNSMGQYLGGSRRPTIPVRDLKPGESAEFDYYPKEALRGTRRVTIEVERLLKPEDEKFIAELPK